MNKEGLCSVLFIYPLVAQNVSEFTSKTEDANVGFQIPRVGEQVAPSKYSLFRISANNGFRLRG